MSNLLRFGRSIFKSTVFRNAVVTLLAATFALGVAAANTPSVTPTVQEAKKIAKSYETLVSKVQNESTIAIIARVPLSGATEGSAGSYKQGLKDLKKIAKTLNVKIRKEIARQGVVSLLVTLEQLDALIGSGVIEVLEENSVSVPMLNTSIPWINGDVYHALGHTGVGKAVAILDTGVDTTHPFLSDRIVEQACFSSDLGTGAGVCPNGQDTMFGLGAGDDPCDMISNGDCQHGTHVAGIAAGADAGMFGVAPGADIVTVQVFHYTPGAARMGAHTSDILAGLDWVLYDATSDIAAINMSIGGGLHEVACDSDIVAGAIAQLRQAGVATVIAAGNNSSQTSVSWPGCVSDAITVASSLPNSDTYSGFSNVSPLVDVVAPGSSIYSSIPGGGFGYKGGTSMATPHVAGAVTALKAQFPGATVEDIEFALESSGDPVVQASTGISYPRINMTAAAQSLMSGGSLVLEAETQTWDNAAVESEHAGFSGTGYVNTENAAGEWIEFALNVPEAGSYPLTVSYANGGAARPADISVNGEYKVLDSQFAGTGAWDLWGQETFNVTLIAGYNTVRLIAVDRSGLANIDRLATAVPQVNHAPVVVNPIADIVMDQGDPSYIVNLNTVFYDQDGDTLYFEKDSSNNDSLNVRFVSAFELEIDPVESGEEWFEIRAFDDDDAEVTLRFTMTVNEVNIAPVVTNPIANITLAQGAPSYLIDLNQVFSDADGDILSFSREASDDESLNLMFASTTELQVNAVELGTVSHYIIASDGRGGFASNSFDLTILPNASNNAPVITNTIEPIVISGLYDDTIVSLANYFADPDGDTLTYSATSSNSSVISVSIDDGVLILSSHGTYGAVVIKVTATDGEYSVSMDVNASIYQPNQAPIVVNPINDITMTQGEPSYVIDLNRVFSDPDGDTLAFDKDSSNSDSSNVRFISATELEISAVELGTEWFEIRAFDSSSAEATLTFDVTVVAANLPPIVVNPIADIQMNLGDAPISIDLNTVFSDPEGGTLTFDHYAMDEDLDDVTLFADGILQIDAEYAGSNTHTLYAFDDEGQEVVLEFNVDIVSGGFSVELQAEDQTWKKASVDSNHTGYTGAGFVNTENVNGTWFDASVDVPAAGSYLVSVRFANGSTNRSQQIYINGDLGPAVDFSNSGGWANWLEQSFVISFSNPGVNTVRLVSLTSGGAPNLDRLIFTLQ